MQQSIGEQLHETNVGYTTHNFGYGNLFHAHATHISVLPVHGEKRMVAKLKLSGQFYYLNSRYLGNVWTELQHII